MSNNSNKYENIKIRTCRICLDAKCVDMVLLDEQNGWLNLFEYCFGFTLTIQDEPRLLCKLCADKVQSYVQFKKKCEKSHNLWQSVISDVKCYVVKHHNIENTNQNINGPITNTTKINDELFDESFDNDLNFSNDDETLNFLSTEIKIENDEEDDLISKLYLKKIDDDNDFKKLDDKNCFDRYKVDSEQINPKKITSNGSVKTGVNKVYTCIKCKKDYAKRRWYHTHIKNCQAKRPKRGLKINHDPDYAYDCGRIYNSENIAKIKEEFQSENCIDNKIIENQHQDDLYLCGLCKLSFSSTNDVCKHLNEHWSNNDLACKLCDFVGIDLAAMAAHRFSHYPRKGKMRFLCHICEMPLMSLLALHFHYRSVHLKKVGGYCSRCNRECPTLKAWKKHERTHSTPKFICDICGKKFIYKYLVREHIMNHVQPKKSICDICGNSFTRISYLKVHINTVHTKTGPFRCTHCNRMFKSEYTLNQHHKNLAKKKTVKCEVCQKEFITPNVLKSHMIMHSLERPYSCEICGASYKAKGMLKVHMRKHTGILPFKCLQCMKAFPTPQQLKVHSSVHTGIRRHRCTVPDCVRTFHSKKLLSAHLALRHKNENGLRVI